MESNSDSPVLSASPPALSAPTGEAQEITAPPVRPSGFVTLILGMLCVLMLVTQAFVVLPILTILLGLYALRPSITGPPVGRRAAMAGMVLAVFFAGWGLVRENLREQELGRTATTFGGYWLELGSRGEWEAVMELMKPPQQRQNPNMPLKAFYANNASRVEAMNDFKMRPVVVDMIDAGQQVQWKPSDSPRVYDRRGEQYVEVRFEDQNQVLDHVLRIEMQRIWDPQTQTGEWVVHDFGTL